MDTHFLFTRSGINILFQIVGGIVICGGWGKLKFGNVRVAKLAGYSDTRSYQRHGERHYVQMLKR